MPFVSIYKKRDFQGTRSDFDGQFVLKNVRQGDVVVCDFVGYQRIEIIAQSDERNPIIKLKNETQFIDEVLVIASESILYKMVSKIKRTASYKNHIAKTYLELETFVGDKQIELFQGYYNGTYQAYNTTSLEMKKGRFALVPVNKRIFASTETSKAIYQHQLLEENEFFPTTPFELSKSRLKKKYQLNLNAKYKDGEGKTIYVIRFNAKEDDEQFFSGNVWIDSTSNQLQKVTLEISNSALHPFAPIWRDHSLSNVDMKMTKTYQELNNEMVISSIDFNYSLDYTSKKDSTIKVSSRAALYAYNYESSFHLPYFNFTSTANSDYRRIQILPYNQKFWECEKEFKLENSEQRLKFIQDRSTIKSFKRLKSDTTSKHLFLRNPYKIWNRSRVLINGLTSKSSEYLDRKRSLKTKRYNLEVQLYAEINELCDSFAVVTKTIFDPYETYYHFEVTKESQVFLNIYFDLVEIERRQLRKELEKVKYDRKEVEKIYRRSQERLYWMSRKYFSEVQRGTNLQALKKWNNLVLNELYLDNFKLFEGSIP